ncbi:FitA-like ribbon-helix-helix domain-containing protein [Nocardia brasiliensis]|uniref:FitA-like ribbon-helix-helix domain-containing protein n=1 Tax=Nocardia brasiliensis TaxID=37326 RepID=UPI001894BA98|nr:antitoxin [Nocardia brasiliensis]MBF6125942.1 antitoxin [Nocardia brasiliensis]
MATIQVRDIPDEDAEVFRQRAEAAGMSLQAYMRRELIAMAHRRTKAEAMAAIRDALDRDPLPGGDAESILDALREARGE